MTNFLDIHCPQCQRADRIDIAATLWVRLLADGTDADESRDGSHEYDPRSTATCAACGYSGRLSSFPDDLPEELTTAIVEVA